MNKLPEVNEPVGSTLMRHDVIIEHEPDNAFGSELKTRRQREEQLLEDAGREIVQRSHPAGSPGDIGTGERRQRQLHATRLGTLLSRAGLLTAKQLAKALRLQKRTGQKIGEVLVAMGCVTPRAVWAGLALQGRLRRLLALGAVCGMMAMATGCNSYNYKGTPVGYTPWDGHWNRVKAAVQEAATISYRTDAGGEQWQTPQETEVLRAGDCEDVSIWLYAKLLREGVEDARICIGKRSPGDPKFHCWVVWMAGDTTYILDPSTSGSVSKARLFPAGHYEPHYSYDLNGKYSHQRT